MPSAKNTSPSISTSSGTTSMIVLISQPFATFIPAQRSQTGQNSPPESQCEAESTSWVFSQTRM